MLDHTLLIWSCIIAFVAEWNTGSLASVWRQQVAMFRACLEDPRLLYDECNDCDSFAPVPFIFFCSILCCLVIVKSIPPSCSIYNCISCFNFCCLLLGSILPLSTASTPCTFSAGLLILENFRLHDWHWLFKKDPCNPIYLCLSRQAIFASVTRP